MLVWKGKERENGPGDSWTTWTRQTTLNGKINGMNDQTIRKSKEAPKFLSIAMGFAPGRARGTLAWKGGKDTRWDYWNLITDCYFAV